MQAGLQEQTKPVMQQPVPGADRAVVHSSKAFCIFGYYESQIPPVLSCCNITAAILQHVQT